VLDVLFAEPERASASEAEGDRVLAEAIGRGKLVLGMAFAEHGAKPVVKAGFASPATIRVPSCRPSRARSCRSLRSASRRPVSAP
jgi:CHASE2 domain-containing sensor protein